MKRRASGFTLLELLVVIGIICILISLLLSVISSARQSAQRSTCQQNLRNLMTAIIAYTTDNDGWLPYCNWNDNIDNSGTTPPCYGAGWLYSSLNLRKGSSVPSIATAWNGLRLPPVEGVQSGVIYPYLKTLTSYHCSAEEQQLWTGQESLTTYVMNGAEWCYAPTKANTLADFYSGKESSPGHPANPGTRTPQFPNPTTSAFLIERMNQMLYAQNNVTVVTNSPPAGAPNEYTLTTRHNKGGNVAMLDGHVEFWMPAEYNMWVAQITKPGPLWYNPNNLVTGQ